MTSIDNTELYVGVLCVVVTHYGVGVYNNAKHRRETPAPDTNTDTMV